MSKRKYAVKLIEKKSNPDDTIWAIIYAKKAKDYEGNVIYLADNQEAVTLRGLDSEEGRLSDRQKDIKDMIKAIKKELNHNDIENI